jgi:Txe/YoeB family toxin of Txe-Axe toxin-antitoxin module
MISPTYDQESATSAIPSFDNKKYKLISWLKKRNRIDGQLSEYYKSRFNITDHHQIIYQPDDNDIDIMMSRYNHAGSDQMTDRQPINLSDDIDELSDDQCIRISFDPMSNHSNANFLFKEVLSEILNDMTVYDIPIVSSDPTVQYEGHDYEEAYIGIDKVDFYNFMLTNSRK